MKTSALLPYCVRADGSNTACVVRVLSGQGCAGNDAGHCRSGQMRQLRDEHAAEEDAADHDLVRVVQAHGAGHGGAYDCDACGKAQDDEDVQYSPFVDRGGLHVLTLTPA